MLIHLKIHIQNLHGLLHLHYANGVAFLYLDAVLGTSSLDTHCNLLKIIARIFKKNAHCCIQGNKGESSFFRAPDTRTGISV